MSPQLSQLSYSVLQVSIHQTHLLTYLPTLSPYHTQLYIETSLTYSDRRKLTAMRCGCYPTSFSGIWNGSNPIIFTILPRKPVLQGGNDEESNLNIMCVHNYSTNHSLHGYQQSNLQWFTYQTGHQFLTIGCFPVYVIHNG